MAFQTPITIKEAIENINNREYLLPAIQRDFVWNYEQIEKLFDSLMRDYPIGSFLLWKVKSENVKDFQFYEFISNYSQFDKTINSEAIITDSNDIISILDGQQRLTSLYIGLMGSYAYKKYRAKISSKKSYPKRELYLNLMNYSNNSELKYEFKFLAGNDDKTGWFKVKDILTLNEAVKINDYIFSLDFVQNNMDNAKLANKILFKLFEAIHIKFIINYYLEDDQSLDKVLNIFIRVNSGGTQLSYSDLLLSIATAQWENKDARKTINNFVNELNNGTEFNFIKDFILKSCLVLSDFKNIAFKVDNFKKSAMLDIENKWDNISEALNISAQLLSSFGFNEKRVSSYNAMIPIAYYIMGKNSPSNFVTSNKFETDRKNIFKFFNITQLKRTFGGAPDNILVQMRKIIKNHNNTFPLDKIIESRKGTAKDLDFDDNSILNLFNEKYGGRYTFSTLSLLYSSLDFSNKFDLDHIFPKSFFTRKKLEKRGFNEDKINFYIDNFNKISNLQLLDETKNMEKVNSDFETWLNTKYENEIERRDFMRKNYIPDIDLSFDNFEEFILEREKLMKKEFDRILKNRL
ncbi:MAG: DUF262 domain-containing protein [Methanobacteriaceae archaeon]